MCTENEVISQVGYYFIHYINITVITLRNLR